jgi:predicted Zn-dependent protease
MKPPVLAIVLVAAGAAAPQKPAGKEAAAKPTAVLAAMKEELARSLSALQGQPLAPYFLSYEITETQSASVRASFGALTWSGPSRRRDLDIDLRVGDYALDNSHTVRGGGFSRPDRQGYDVPVEDDAAAIRSVLWFHTDQRYRRAVEQLTKVKTNVQVKVEEEDRAGDFSKEAPQVHVQAPAVLKLDRKAWEDKLRKYTRPFARHGDIYDADANLQATAETRWYTNSEGSALQTAQTHYRLSIRATTKADDGMELPRYETFAAFSPEGLPDDATVLRAVERIIQDLQALRRAPLVDPYTGPAILSGRAASVFFHEIFGHRVEGHRLKDADDSQTFKKKLNQPVLPEGFSIHFDPTVARAADHDLVGHYEFDNQGVKARRVTVVDKGVFKSFLMSRSPIEGFPASNGHGRKQVGFNPVSRQSNLLVEVAQPLSRAALKQRLLDEIKAADKPFGLLFADIQGGFTFTGRTMPNAFNVLPVLVYRVYPDGREELVRGVDLIGTPLTAFSRIAAADDQVEVFNGVCGAESGGVPVSAAAPAVLVSQIEVQKKTQSQDRPPLLPAPLEPAAQGDPLMKALRDELARNVEKLRVEKLDRPYFIAYTATEYVTAGAAAAFGAVASSGENRSRTLEAEVRVGDRSLDNTGYVSPPGAGGVRFSSGASLPIDDDYGEIRRQVWLVTDGAYKKALEDLSRKRAYLQTKSRSDDSPDFSQEEPATVTDEARVAVPRLADLEAQVKSLSAVFREAPDVLISRVSVSSRTVVTRYVNSEGTSFVRTRPRLTLQVTAATQAADGMPLEDFLAFYGRSAADLPAAEELRRQVKELAAGLARRRQAATLDTYNGPVLFEGQAAAELFAQAFAPKLLATRVPIFDDSRFGGMDDAENAFLDRLGGRVLPEFLSVTDDPTAQQAAGVSLMGGYPVDDDGVRARATPLIENGVLKTLLSTRTPMKGITRSSGNRRGNGPMPSNLVVSAPSGLPREEMKAALLKLVQERGAPFGVVVRRLGNPSAAMRPFGETAASRPGDRRGRVEHATLAFKVLPDGSEEPLRLAEITGVSADSFKEIAAASKEPTVYTALFSPPSGPSAFMGPFRPPEPVSYVMPALLFKELSLKKPSGEIPRPVLVGHPHFAK